MAQRPSPTTHSQIPSPLVFISYCHKDEKFRERLVVHLAPLVREGVKTWVDSDLLGGDELDPTISRALRQADIFIALASPDYLHSSYCFDREYQFALRKARRKKLHVLVAIARHCQWKRTRMGRYLALPKDGRAIEDFPRRSHAYEQIVEGVRGILKRVRLEKEAATAAATREGGRARIAAKVTKAGTARIKPPSKAENAVPRPDVPAKSKPKSKAAIKRAVRRSGKNGVDRQVGS
jgi:hypothetical protein